MKAILDNLNSLTGWSASGGATVYNTNDVTDYIAGNNTSSIIMRFNALNSYVEKSYSYDVSSYNILTIWIYSRTKGDPQDKAIGDFSYKIDLGSGEEFAVQLDSHFSPIVLDISAVNTITKIKITSLHSNDDYLFMSYAVVSTDIFPLDIYVGIKEQLEFERDNFYSVRQVGTITGTTGDAEITFNAYPDFIDKFSVVEIDDGVNSEIHHLLERGGDTFQLGQLHDGTTLLNTYTNAPVYLYYPIDYGMSQKEISLPSITLWGFASEKEIISSEFDIISDSISITNNTYQTRQVGQYLNWEILIDCEERESYEILGELSKIVRNFLGKRIIWVNGRKINIEPTAAATEIEATDNFDIVPKIQYPCTVQIREEIYNRVTTSKVLTTNIDISIQEDFLNG